MTMFPTRKTASSMILDVARQLVRRGYALSEDVSISAKLTSETVLITGIPSSLRHLEEEDLVVVDMEGNLVGGAKYFTPSPDVLLHLEIYKNKGMMTLGAVLAQPTYATIYAALGKSLDRPVLARTVQELGIVPHVPYARPGTAEAAETIRPYLAGHNGLLLGNRGALTWGSNLFEAYKRMEILEQYAQTEYFLSKIQDPPRLLSSGEIGKLLQDRKKLGNSTGSEKDEILYYKTHFD